MPELPEVETVARRLRKELLGRTVISAQIAWPRTIACPAHLSFGKRIIGQQFASVDRRGKYLVFGFARGESLLAHLRMSGDLVVRGEAEPCLPHDRVSLTLDSSRRLVFNDPRKFGRLYLVDSPEEIVGKLGPEPFDRTLTPQIFYAALQKRRGALKSLLLDQSFLAGLGNIYVVESLWHAKLHPLCPANQVTHSKARLLLSVIRHILSRAILAKGTDIGDGVWKAGNYRTRAYGRASTPCCRCNTPIVRIVLGQRGTEFCPRCQRNR